MSWLFDRLCELAAADRVEVIIAADISEPPQTDDSADFADVLLRASQVPQLTVWVVGVRGQHQTSLGRGEPVELDVLTEECARSAIQRLLRAQQRSDGDVLQIESNTTALVPSQRAERAMLDLTTNDPTDVRWLFATDRAGHTEVFGHLAQHGLGIAIGGIDPNAAVKVPDMMGAIAIVDALVTLRSFAFGVNAAGPPITTHVEWVGASYGAA